MKAVYEAAGVPTRAFVPNANQTYPAFEAVQDELRVDKDNQALLGRMSPIFDLELFSSGAQVTDSASVVEQSTVIRLAQLPGDEVQNSVAEFFLMALYNYLIRQAQSHRLTRLAVLDEAWRLVESPFLEPLMQEGRAFGLGVVIASQFPTDLPTASRVPPRPSFTSRRPTSNRSATFSVPSSAKRQAPMPTTSRASCEGCLR